MGSRKDMEILKWGRTDIQRGSSQSSNDLEYTVTLLQWHIEYRREEDGATGKALSRKQEVDTRGYHG